MNLSKHYQSYLSERLSIVYINTLMPVEDNTICILNWFEHIVLLRWYGQ